MTKEEQKEYNKKYNEDNKYKIKKSRKQYRENNKEKIKESAKKYRENNKEKINEYREANKYKRKIYNKTYRDSKKDKNKPLIPKQQKQKNKKQEVERVLYKRKTDPIYNMMYKIRERTRKAVKRNNISKNSSTMKMLGCDKNTLMEHLQKTGELYDPNFNVYDYDGNKYHIDHKKTFADVQNGIYTLEEVCHYTNLQILPAEINLSKGGNSW